MATSVACVEHDASVSTRTMEEEKSHWLYGMMTVLQVAAGSRPRFDDINARVETLKTHRDPTFLPSFLLSFLRFTRIIRSCFRVVSTMKRQTATRYQFDQPPTRSFIKRKVTVSKHGNSARVAGFTQFPYKSHCRARLRTRIFTMQSPERLILSPTPPIC